MMSPEMSSDIIEISVPKYTGRAGVVASRSVKLLINLAVIGFVVGSMLAVHSSTGIPFTSPVPSQTTAVTP